MPREHPERDALTLHDIDRFAARALEFAAGMTAESFAADEKTQAAVLHQITLIGEAVKRLSEGFCARHQDVPWSQIARMRDILIHHYDRVDQDEVWQVVVRDLPRLRADIERIIGPA